MKTKKLVLIIPFLLLIIGMVGCDEKISVTDLYHTWKLEGFGNKANNSFEEAEPKDCEECYILTFSEDGTLSGHTTTNTVFGEYTISEKNINIVSFGGTEVGELGHGYKYSDAMCLIDSYEIVKTKLKLYYNQRQNYLLFNFSKK
jgi:hypothetical protein